MGGMAQTAKRRWSRELQSEIDGIAFAEGGPVLLHQYDPPPGGKWIDAVIPGKLGALDRNSGETLWMAPCEVGYGRGFGAGVVRGEHVIVVGPSSAGHRVVRQNLKDGELVDAEPIPEFDHAVVEQDMVVLSTGRSVVAHDTLTLMEAWNYAREGERYHEVAWHEGRVFVVYSVDKGYGVLELSAELGEFERVIVPPKQKPIRDLCVVDGVLAFLGSEFDRLLSAERLSEYTSSIALHPSGGARDTLSVAAIDTVRAGDVRWFEVLETCSADDMPSISLTADSGKLYISSRAMLRAVDAVTGRGLGNWTVPGLDEKVAFSVASGAGLLAEETRVSLFELPA